MRAVVQRVASAAVDVGDEVVAEIGRGLAVLVGVAPGDTAADAHALGDKLVGLRIFGDAQGRMNLSVAEAGGEVLVVSQFTLLADVRRGRRPSFTGAADPEVAEPLVAEVAARVAGHGVRCPVGRFGATMQVRLVNDGPVTVVVDVDGGRVS